MSEAKTEEAVVEENPLYKEGEAPPVGEEPEPYQPEDPVVVELPEPVYGDPDAEPEPSPMEANPEYYAKVAETGVYGDPDAEPGYFVDENFRPNPLDVGTVTTTDYHGLDPNDLKPVSGLFSNAGLNPRDLEEEGYPESPEPPPQAEATEYDVGVVPVTSLQADPAQQTTTQVQADHARQTREAHAPQPAEAAPQAAPGAEKAAPPVKATQATKKATKASPAGTKDTAMEDPA